MTAGGSFTIQLSEADLVAAFRLHARLKRIRPLILAAILLGMILVLMLVALPEARYSATSRPLTLMLEGALVLLLLLVVPLALAIRPLWRMAARRNFAQRRDLAEPIAYEFSPDMLRHVTCFSDSSYPWPALYGWREDEHLLMIYPSAQLFYVIPKAQVEPAILAALRSTIEAAGVPAR